MMNYNGTIRIAHHQPTWVCDDCGQKYGSWYDADGTYHGPESRAATYHIGDKCDVCKRNTVAVTEARDFGYLIEGWQPRLLVE